MVLLDQDLVLDGLEIDVEGKGGTMVDEVELLDCINLSDRLLNIIHWNIRSIKKNFDNLILLLETFKLSFCDIIILSECFQVLSVNQFNIPGYDAFYSGGDYNRNDGVIIFVRSSLSVSVSHTGLPNSGATVSRISFAIGGITFGVTAAYKPPPITEQNFIEDISSYFEENPSNHVDIFTGDININILKVEDDVVSNYLSTMARMGFTPYINAPTRFETKTCIDHIFIRQKLKLKSMIFETYILNSHSTDHAPVMLNVCFTASTPTSETHNSSIITKKELNLSKFKQLLGSQDWSCILNTQDPEEATNLFVSTYKNLMKVSETTFTMTIRNRKKIKKWITNGIITSIKHRDKLKRKLLKNYSLELEQEYKTYRNYLNKLIHKQKNEYYSGQVNKNKNNLKKIYAIIRDATNECGPKKHLLEITDDSDAGFNNDADMADFCNNYYINVGKEMAKKIPLPRSPLDVDFVSPESMFLEPITENDVIKHISTLKSGSSPGHDGISADIIKHTHTEIVTPLTHIINRTFETGIVPSHFKISIVTPIHKAGSKKQIQNYRPISLISNYAKIFEKCLKEKILNFFKINNILSSNQFGFVEGLSTSDAMYKLTSEVVDNLNSSKKCIGVFIDLAKAFDTVPHERIIDVLSHYGIRGIVSKLMSSYLKERYQFVKANHSLSRKQKIEIGVPQGTVLGPVLFVAYINSLLRLETGGMMISYADDTALIFNGDNWNETKQKVVKGLRTVKNWLESYKLTLNVEKTNYIAFSLTNANRPDFTNIQISNNSCINEVEHTKYLGIVVDRFLKWNMHIDCLTNKIRKLIHKFYLLREFMSRRMLVTIYKSLVESLIRYGILVWGGMYITGLYKLNIIQKYILKIIYRKKRMYPSNLLFSEDVGSVHAIYILVVCSYYYSHEKNYVDHLYETRNSTNKHLKIPLNHKHLNLKFVNYIGPKIYNLLPNHIKIVENKKKFNIQCRKYIFDRYEVFLRVLK